MPYTAEFPHSEITQRMANFLPAWMKARKDPESNFQQFMNTFGLEMETLENFLEEALNSQYIGLANLGDVDWIYRTTWPTSLENKRYTATGDGTGLSWKTRLREFYEEDDDVIIADWNEGLVYTRQHYDSLVVGGVTLPDLEEHHVWNVFDEFALLAGIRRKHLETNADLKERIVNRFKWIPSPNKEGLLNLVATEVGLVAEETWDASQSTFTPNEGSALTHSFFVGSMPAGEGQWTGNELQAKLKVLTEDNAREIEGVEFKNGTLMLKEGSLEGDLWTDPIEVGNLSQWSNLIWSGTGDLTIKAYSYTVYMVSNRVPLETFNLSEGTQNYAFQEEISVPIVLRIQMTRDNADDDSPTVSSLEADYDNSEATVTYLHGVEIDALHDDAFHATLLDNEGQPTKELELYVEELLTVVPIFWDKFKWDESYWDVIEESSVGLKVLPSMFDPDLSGIADRYYQTGIGDRNDGFVEVEDWKPKVHKGHIFPGTRPEGEYIFANVVSSAGSGTQLLVDNWEDTSSPIFVEGVTGGETFELTEVAFLDEEYNVTITNSETVIMGSDPELVLTYKGIDPSSVTLSSGTFDSGSYDGSNILPLVEDGTLPNEGDEIVVTYKIEHSFCVVAKENGYEINCSQEYDTITAYYEGSSDPYWALDHLSIDSVQSVFPSGFLYIQSDQPSVPSSNTDRYGIVPVVEPAELKANGASYSIITADLLDSYFNPLWGKTIDASVSGERDDDQTPLGDPGTVELVDSEAHRHVFKYTTPDTVPVNSTITITLTSGELSKDVTITVLA